MLPCPTALSQETLRKIAGELGVTLPDALPAAALAPASAIAAALGKVAESTELPEARTSEAEREKEEEKKIAFDPLNAIRDALDKIDAAILQTIDENLMLKA